ncbi:MAG TPA: universal stress protein [Burkholderiales bacterium]|nr:universal stress protein [Burkholderiales bacterium]
MAYKRILVPVDGSTTSAKGMQEAIKIAKQMRARLRLLHVVEEYAAFAAPEVGVNVGPLLDAMKSGGRKTLARVERDARSKAKGVRFDTALVEEFGGRVADAIIAQARRWHADLIVIGTHGRRGLQRALMGSDAELVVRYSPLPVLLVPARGRGKR